jgi:photosystem II stability/assembly factor-like uncharacterized protein
MRQLVQTLFFFFLVTQFCFAQWEWQSPLVTSNTLNDVILIDSNHGWAVGDNGIILFTTDDGINWSKQESESMNNLKGVCFVDIYNGWAVGDSGIILKTSNGGVDWIQLTSGTNNNLWDITLSDINNGWAVGNQVILKTTNGGTNWSIQSNSNDLRSVCFVDSNNGWIVGDGPYDDDPILHTTNGGTTWTMQSNPLQMVDGWLQEVYFIDLNNGYAVGHHSSGAGWFGTILRTTNGGLTWTSIPNGTNTILHSVKFTDLNNGWIVGGRRDYGERALVLKTTNSGLEWSKEILKSDDEFKAVCFRNNSVGSLVGEFGTIFNSTDSGNNWISPPAGSTINWKDVFFKNENEGLLVGEFGFIWRTTNGGETWITQLSGTSNHLNEVFFSNSNTGWAVGDSGTIIKTSDGGLSWIQQSSGTFFTLNSVCFIDEYNGWVCGCNYDAGEKVMIKTTNAGINWVQQPTDSFLVNLTSIYFINNNIGWLINGGIWMNTETRIHKTTDGGLTWILKLLIPGNYAEPIGLHRLQFINPSYGIAVGGGSRVGGHIYKTTDGGEFWTEQIFPGAGEFKDVFLINESLGTMVGYDWYNSVGIILRTVDGGTNWNSQISNTANDLKGVYFTDAFTGWIVGNNGTILHTTNGGVSFVEEKQMDEIPTEFLLLQNYPNPFNPCTKIKYSVPQSSQVVVKVFDVLGNEIETLVNEEKPIGTYEINWNAANLPSGVYFYQLRAGSFVETKKMLLMK